MITEGFTLVQVLGVVALAIISTGVVSMVVRAALSKETRVSDGWKRYAEKLEKQLELRELQCAKENARKDAQIIEQEDTIRQLNHALRNVQTTVQITSDVKALETQLAKEEIHEAVDASINKIT